MRAVNEHRAVRFMYRNRGQVKAQRRHVHPYHIGYVDNHWCVFAFDVDRKAIRTFVLTRLSKPELTRKRFTVSQKFDLNKYLAGSLGLYRGEDDFEVVVELDAWAADDVRGRRLHSSQEVIGELRALNNGDARLDNLYFSITQTLLRNLADMLKGAAAKSDAFHKPNRVMHAANGMVDLTERPFAFISRGSRRNFTAGTSRRLPTIRRRSARAS